MTPDGNSEVVFSLKHGDNKGGCAVRLPNRGNTIVSFVVSKKIQDDFVGWVEVAVDGS